VITHIVTFKLSDSSPDHLAHCKDLLEGLPAKVPLVRTLRVGINIVESPRAHDLAVIATFDDLDGLQAYQDHPEHVLVATYMRSSADSVVAVDFED
jgi:hypothetical protein